MLLENDSHLVQRPRVNNSVYTKRRSIHPSPKVHNKGSDTFSIRICDLQAGW